MSSVSDKTLNCLYGSAASPAAQRLLATLEDGDVVLLLGEAVSLARATHPALTDWQSRGAKIFALKEDIEAYAIIPVHASVRVLDYAGWVNLSELHRTQTLWR
jgi:sulfur relay protein TusB/DsrH